MPDNMVIRETTSVQADDGQTVFLRRWLPPGTIRAAVQISHGMVEHSGRYDWFAENLALKGFAVYAHDHRGHGNTAGTPENLGFLAESDGFNRVIEDVHVCIGKIHADYPQRKVFLLGHSFGSFISQGYIERYGDSIDGCMLSGSAGPRPMLVRTARLIAGIIKSIFGGRHRSHFINNLAFGSYNSRIQNKRTQSDWLSRDEVLVDLYNQDPFCQFIPTTSFFYDLFDGLCRIHTEANIKQIPVSLPIFLFAGTADPVGSYGKTVEALYDIYRKNGITDLELKLYPGARHELLNEVNREEALADILAWLDRHC